VEVRGFEPLAPTLRMLRPYPSDRVICALTWGYVLNTSHRFAWFRNVSRTERARSRLPNPLPWLPPELMRSAQARRRIQMSFERRKGNNLLGVCLRAFRSGDVRMRRHRWVTDVRSSAPESVKAKEPIPQPVPPPSKDRSLISSSHLRRHNRDTKVSYALFAHLSRACFGIG